MQNIAYILAIFFLSISTIYSQVLDLSYGNNGIVSIDKYDDPGQNFFPILQDDGSMYLVGIPAQSFMNSGVYLTRITPEGLIDLSFGLDGFVEYDVGEGFTFLSDAIQLDNGNILIGGISFQNAWMLMYDADGNLVDDFGDNGFVDTNLRGDVNRIFLAQDGDKIMAVHKETIGGSAVIATSLFHSDGEFDVTYGITGTIKYGGFGFVNALNHVEMLKNENGLWKGAYISAYQLNGENVSFIVNLQEDGNINPNFADDGVYRMTGGNSIRTFTLDLKKNLILSTLIGDNYEVYKLDADGNPILEFGDDGVYTESLSLPINNSVDIIPTINNELIHLFTADEHPEYKPLIVKHEEDGSEDDVLGEIIYDQTPVLALDMRHQKNGDIFIMGMTIEEMGNLEFPTIIKYKSDLTNVIETTTSNIVIRPNPNTTTNWVIEGNVQKITSAHLTDINGTFISPLTIEGNQLTTQSFLMNGMYLINLLTENGQTTTTKVMIVK